MKNVLIWNISFPIKNCGGPAGYLYNLKTYLDNNPNNNITFLTDILDVEDTHKMIQNDIYHRSLKSCLSNTWLGTLYKECRSLNALYNKKRILPSTVDLTKFDVIHFHVIYDVFRYSEYLKDYKGHILLTSHMPEPPIVELSYDYKIIGGLLRLCKDYFVKKEISFLSKYDVSWMFPSKYAIEPYTQSSSCYKDYFNNMAKLHYVPTCILDYKVLPSNNFWSQYGIPSDAFVLTYIGRHNNVKGYGLLKEIGRVALNKIDNLYIVVAGKEEPLQRYDHPRWIELGWISNSPEIISNSDAFILPNLQTYFDIVFLEVLRSGTVMLASYTGGNKHFDKEITADETKGIFFFQGGDVSSAITMLEKIVKFDTVSLGVSNRILFESRFTLEHYVKNYIKMINEL